MEFKVTPTPELLVAFLASMAGIAFVLLSRNVAVKRIVLPITLVVFSVMWLEVFRRATSSSGIILALVGAGLLVNAVWVMRRLSYCTACGRTMQDQSPTKASRCPGCSAAV
jgi:uncharacterized membrane protein